MTTTTWPFPLQASHRDNFIAGWDKYVERGSFTKPAPDVYWNPRAGQWQTYAPGKWHIVDDNLPSIGDISFFTNAGEIFDRLTDQWSALAPPKQQAAVWDGRRHKWMLSESGPGTDSCRKQYEEGLAFLRQLHTSGALTDALFEKQATDLWNKYQACEKAKP